MYLYDAKGQYGQINLQEGELVWEVTADSGGWTVVRNAAGVQGAVPSSYIGLFLIYGLMYC